MIKKKLKVFCTTWHIMHYWDLFAALEDYCDFYLCHNSAKSWRDPRFLRARPIPKNAQFVCAYEEGIYDFAILNVDQQVVKEELGKSRVSRELLEAVTNIPKVVINHASPVWPEELQVENMTKRDAEEECKRLVKQIVGDAPMITNSYDAASSKEWGWGYPIWHGMDPKQWYDLPKEPRVFTAVSAAGCGTYYNRAMMNEVGRILKEEGYMLYWAKHNVASEGNLEFYKYMLGSSLIYFDGSIRTPMNRGRTEAMLSGACVVQVEGAHDLERFAENGKNMILVPNNPKEIAGKLIDLLDNQYRQCKKIGQEGKKTAKRIFNRKRYRDDWLKFIKEVLKIKV